MRVTQRPALEARRPGPGSSDRRAETPQMHLVLTGRNAHGQVIELTDTVSEIVEVKHAYRQGIEPQPGTDYWEGSYLITILRVF